MIYFGMNLIQKVIMNHINEVIGKENIFFVIVKYKSDLYEEQVLKK